MSVRLEFINLIVRIDKIKEKYPGGWEQCLNDHERWIGGRIWFDEYLFRDGAMDPATMQMMAENWEAMGFETIIEREGRKVWGDDLCVVDQLVGPTLPCEWIKSDLDSGTVYLKGTEPGKVMGRGEEQQADIVEIDDDVLYQEAKNALIETGNASAAYIQRVLGVDRAQAERLIHLLEERGIVGPAEGSHPRKLLGK